MQMKRRWPPRTRTAWRGIEALRTATRELPGSLRALFLADNGYRLRFDPSDAVKTMEMVAAGTLDEAGLAEWFRQRIVV
jgi:hypothetical protein